MDNCEIDDRKRTLKDEETIFLWYTDMVENYPDRFVYYLTDDAVLSWFGRTVKGTDKILRFVKNGMHGIKHLMTSFIPVERHDITEQNYKYKTPTLYQFSSFNHVSKNQENSSNSMGNNPKRNEVASTSNYDPMACGDGPAIGNITPKKHVSNVNLHRICTPYEDNNLTKFINCSGIIEFTQPLHKREFPIANYVRPCTLNIAYYGETTNINGLNIVSILYDDNKSCRKNLLPEFEMSYYENYVDNDTFSEIK